MTSSTLTPPKEVSLRAKLRAIYESVAGFIRRRGIDLALSEGVLLAGLASAFGRFVPQLWPIKEFPWAIGALWAVWHLIFPTHLWRLSNKANFRRLALEILGLGAIGTAVLLGYDQALIRPHAVLLCWSGLFLAMVRPVLQSSGERGFSLAAENLRWLVLGAVGYWLFGAYMTPVQQGGGDARWYGTMLADMLTQVRAGIFPVFIGQSEYQFNGAVYPLRVAPGFHYFGALLDLATGQCLPGFTVMNLLLTTMGVATLFCAYFCLAAVNPVRRWVAALLAILFVTCPGVVGVAYNSDLYMSWMTLPFIPLVFYATLRSFDQASPRIMAVLGVSLGCMFWGHSPLALWAVALAGVTQVVRIVARPRRSLTEVKAFVVGAVVFLATAAYPVGSVLFFPLENGVEIADLQTANVGNILFFIRDVYPKTFQGISKLGRELSDLQLGYGLWAVLALAGAFALVRKRLSAAVLTVLAIGIALLLTPVFDIEEQLWSLVPALLRNPTGNWAMNRLYVMLAATTVFAAMATWPAAVRLFGKIVQAASLLLLVACAAWSITQANQFVTGTESLSGPIKTANRSLLPENIMVTRFAYFVFRKFPAYFNHGTVDPTLENRLFDSSWRPLDSNEAAVEKIGRPVSAPAVFKRIAGRNLGLDRPIVLQPGHRYALIFNFDSPEVKGTLQLAGATFFREYGIPEYGNSASFGAGGSHSRLLSIWTSGTSPEPVKVIFFPDDAIADPNVLLPLAHVQLIEYDSNALPIQIESWLPYKAKVQSPETAWLETPRMYQRHYHVEVNGKPARFTKSPEALLGIEVPAGSSIVTANWSAPFGLLFLFWMSFGTICFFGLTGLLSILKFSPSNGRTT